MNRSARVLAFPLSIAAVMAADGCSGVSIDDPMVAVCHDDTTRIDVEFSNGTVARDTMILHDRRICRKAA